MNRNEISNFLKFSYDCINSDLKFSETKNTFLVTFNTAIIGVIVALLTKELSLSCISKTFLIIFSLLMLIATLISIFSFIPINKVRNLLKTNCNKYDKPNFMFYLYNASKFQMNDKERYNKFESQLIENCKFNDNFSFFEKELIYQIVDLSNVAFTKFKLFSYAIYIELIATIFFALFLIVEVAL